MHEPSQNPLVISFALTEEAQGLLDQMRRVQRMDCARFVEYRGLLPSGASEPDRPLLVVVTGVGQGRATTAASDVISLYQPRLWLSAGFAGGLSESLRATDILVARQVMDEGSRCTVETAAPTLGLDQLQRSSVHFGDLLSTSGVICASQAKIELGKTTGAVACDMESYTIASLCREAAVAFLAVRVISDTVHESLPRETEAIAKQTTLARRWGAAVGAVWARPSAAAELWNLHERSWESSQRLGEFLQGSVLPAIGHYLTER